MLSGYMTKPQLQNSITEISHMNDTIPVFKDNHLTRIRQTNTRIKTETTAPFGTVDGWIL